MLEKNWWLCTAVAASACENSMRLAASLSLLSLVWRLDADKFFQGGRLACNMSRIGRFLPATGGHPLTICMRLAARRQKSSVLLASHMKICMLSAID
jgi:hypothetical protein